MFEIINYLDHLGMYRLADMVDKKVIAENNFQTTRKHKNVNQSIQMQIFSLQQKLRDMESQNGSGDAGPALKKTKDDYSNKNTNIQYLSNAPLDIDNNGNNNNTKVEITT